MKDKRAISKIVIAVILVVIIAVAGGVTAFYYSTQQSTNKSAFKIVALTSGGADNSWWDTVNAGIIQAVSHVQSTSGLTITVDNVFNVAAADAQGVLSSYATQGYNMALDAESTHDTAAYAVAAQYPKFQIFGNAFGGNLSSNVGTWGWDVWRGFYPAGVIAGLMTKSNVIGFVTGFQFGQSVEGINAFLAGARLVNPQVTIRWVFTSDWHDPTKGASAAAGLIASGVDVVAGMGNGMTDGVLSECAKDNVYSIGYLYDEYNNAPNSVLTSVLWDTSRYFIPGIQDSMAGNIGYKSYTLKLYPDAIATLAPFHGMLPADVEAKANDYIAGIYNGTFREPENTVLPTT